MPPVYPLLEVSAAVLFAVACLLSARRGRLPVLQLVSAAAFGILLEEGDQLIFETYHYSEHWSLLVDRAPVVIGLTWALLITGAMRITDALGVRGWYAAVVDSVLVLTLDLAFDAVAIRMGLWTWRDIGPTDGWFGVPAGNFYSWLFVTLGFSLISRWLARAAAQRPMLEWLQLLVPLPAFVILLSAIAPYAILQRRFEPEPGGGLVLFAVTLAVFVAVTAVGLSRRAAVSDAGRGAPASGTGSGLGSASAVGSDDPELRFAFLTRLSIHAFFLAALFWLGLATRLPVLLVVALAMLALELPLAWLAYQRRPQAASVMRGARREVQRSPDAP